MFIHEYFLHPLLTTCKDSAFFPTNAKKEDKIILNSEKSENICF